MKISKKFLILLLILLVVAFIFIYRNREVPKDKPVKEFILTKIDEEQDFVYFKEYKKCLLGDMEYVYKYPVINIKSEEVDNVNLELRKNLERNYRNSTFTNENLNIGIMDDYDVFDSKSYVSVVDRYHKYLDGIIGDTDVNSYVISKKNGKVVDGKKLLKDYNVDLDDIYSKIHDSDSTLDMAFVKMMFKNYGYNAYVNKDNRLCIIYHLIDDVSNKLMEIVI